MRGAELLSGFSYPPGRTDTLGPTSVSQVGPFVLSSGKVRMPRLRGRSRLHFNAAHRLKSGSLESGTGRPSALNSPTTRHNYERTAWSIETHPTRGNVVDVAILKPLAENVVSTWTQNLNLDVSGFRPAHPARTCCISAVRAAHRLPPRTPDPARLGETPRNFP